MASRWFVEDEEGTYRRNKPLPLAFDSNCNFANRPIYAIFVNSGIEV